MEEYLERGPGFVFLHHPALGPLWEVIGQKLRGGRLAHGAEVVLEVAEAQARRQRRFPTVTAKHSLKQLFHGSAEHRHHGRDVKKDALLPDQLAASLDRLMT